MTDIKNILKVTYPDNGVSVLCYMCVIVHVVIPFFFFFPFFYFIFLFLFLFIYIFSGCGLIDSQSQK